MVDTYWFILCIGVLIFAAHFFEWLFNFTKIPNVLLLMIVGLIVGPIFGIVTPEFFGRAGALFSVIVLTVILFEAGTALRLDVMRQSLRGTLLLTLSSFAVIVAVVGTIIYFATGTDAIIAYMIGAIIGGTSSVVVIPLVEQLRIGGQTQAILMLESALTDVLCVVVTIALIAAYKVGSFSTLAVGMDIVISFAGAAAIGVFGGLLWSLLLVKVRHMHNSIFSTPACVFILFGLAEYVGVSGPIAALAFGITMGNISCLSLYMQKEHSILRHIVHPAALSKRERAFFAEIVFLLQTFFFVFIGMSVTMSDYWILLFAGVLAVVLLILRALVVKHVAPRYLPALDRSIIAAMVPKGLASAVLAMLVAQEGIAQRVFILDTIYAIILFSVVGTSLMIFALYTTRVGRFYERYLDKGRGTHMYISSY